MEAGRNKFERHKGCINVLVKIICIFPIAIRKFLWNSFQKSNRKYAIMVRYVIVKSLSNSMGDNVFIGSDVEIIKFENLNIGSNVSIHKNCYLDATGGITIGDNVSIAHSTSLISFNHTYQDREKPIKYNPSCLKPIILKNDIWIGTGCKILAGVAIEERAIVAAGAIVNKDVKSNTMVGGIPAKVLKEI